MENQNQNLTQSKNQQITFSNNEASTLPTTYAHLAIEEKDIVVALRKPKLSEYGKDHLLTLVDGLIHKTHINCGYKADKEIINQYIDELVSDLVKYNGLLSFQEIEIAFKNGWKGEYGEFMGLNNKTFSTWVTAYRFGVKRANAKIAMQKAGENETKKPEPTEAEKEAIIRESAILKFNEFKTTGSFFGNGNVTYNYLDKKGALTFTKEVKAGFMESARNKLISEEKIKKTDLSNVGKSKAIDDFIKELEETEKHPKVIIEAKQLALTAYFIQLIEMDEELKNII